jgi:hypothetical protein
MRAATIPHSAWQPWEQRNVNNLDTLDGTSKTQGDDAGALIYQGRIPKIVESIREYLHKRQFEAGPGLSPSLIVEHPSLNTEVRRSWPEPLVEDVVHTSFRTHSIRGSAQAGRF